MDGSNVPGAPTGSNPNQGIVIVVHKLAVYEVCSGENCYKGWAKNSAVLKHLVFHIISGASYYIGELEYAVLDVTGRQFVFIEMSCDLGVHISCSARPSKRVSQTGARELPAPRRPVLQASKRKLT